MRWIALAAIYAFALLQLSRAERRSEFILACAVVGLLAVSFVAARLLHGKKVGDDIQVRTETWCWMVATFLLAASMWREVTLLMLAFLSFVALREYFSLLPMYRGSFLRHEDRLGIALAYLTIPVTYVLAWLPWYGFYIILIPVYATLVLPMALVLADNPRGIIVSMGSIFVGMFLFVFLFSHAAVLLWLSPFLLFYAFLITELRDVLAYCFGKALEKNQSPWLRARVAPHINPRKTWVPALLASLGCAGASLALSPLMPELKAGKPTGVFLFVLGFGVGCLGLVGDLATGAIKRDLQVKDTGHSLPGHGGVIDRINGVVFTVPVIFHLMYYYYGGGVLR